MSTFSPFKLKLECWCISCLLTQLLWECIHEVQQNSGKLTMKRNIETGPVVVSVLLLGTFDSGSTAVTFTPDLKRRVPSLSDRAKSNRFSVSLISCLSREQKIQRTMNNSQMVVECHWTDVGDGDAGVLFPTAKPTGAELITTLVACSVVWRASMHLSHCRNCQITVL